MMKQDLFLGSRLSLPLGPHWEIYKQRLWVSWPSA